MIDQEDNLIDKLVDLKKAFKKVKNDQFKELK